MLLCRMEEKEFQKYHGLISCINHALIFYQQQVLGFFLYQDLVVTIGVPQRVATGRKT